MEIQPRNCEKFVSNKLTVFAGRRSWPFETALFVSFSIEQKNRALISPKGSRVGAKLNCHSLVMAIAVFSKSLGG